MSSDTAREKQRGGVHTQAGAKPMRSDVYGALKVEIARIARKEFKSEMIALKSASVRYRADIAALKRQVAALQKDLQAAARTSQSAGSGEQESPVQDLARFSAKALAAQRKRLGLSAEGLGKLIGVSALSIYKWESGSARPRDRYLPAITALKKLKKKTALEVLASR